MGFCDVEYKFKSIGENVRIGKYVYFRYPELSRIGSNVMIDEFCYFSTPVTIKNYIHIAPHSSVIGGERSNFIMLNYSQMAMGCRIICGSDDFLGSGLIGPTIPEQFRSKVTVSDIMLEEHAILGTGCVVHPGVVIREGSVVGSMSLVTKSLDKWGVYKGIPAKFYKERPREIIQSNTRLLELRGEK